MRRSLREDSNLCRTRVRSPVLCPLSYGGMWCVRPLHPSGKKCGWRDSNPHGPRPPVSETGASARFRHIRMRLGAGTPRARAERVTGRKRESRRRLVGLTRHPAGAAARVVPPRGAPCGGRRGRSPSPDARGAPDAEARAGRCAGDDASPHLLSRHAGSCGGEAAAFRDLPRRRRGSERGNPLGGFPLANRSQSAAGEVRDELRRRGVEAHDVEHSRMGRICDRELVRRFRPRPAARRCPTPGGSRGEPGTDGRLRPRSRCRSGSRCPTLRTASGRTSPLLFPS